MVMDFDVTRREFLEVGAAASLTAFTDSRVRIELTPEEDRTLLAMVRTLFPHSGASDKAYSQVAVALKERCRRDATAFDHVTKGMTMLDRLGSQVFSAVSARERVAILVQAKDSRFFRVVYAEALEALYGSPEAWRLFA
jgi:hypothetical protein